MTYQHCPTRATDLSGHLLVASPYLVNPHFARTVVLVVQDNEHGVAGVILNRPLGAASQAIWRHLSQGRLEEGPLPHFGGPLDGPIVALHQDTRLGGFRIGEQLFLAVNVQTLGQLAQEDSRTVRVFIGHAAWGPEQLERELRQGAWMILPADPELVFGDDDQIWSQSVRRVGRNVLSSLVPPAFLDADAARN